MKTSTSITLIICTIIICITAIYILKPISLSNSKNIDPVITSESDLKDSVEVKQSKQNYKVDSTSKETNELIYYAKCYRCRKRFPSGEMHDGNSYSGLKPIFYCDKCYKEIHKNDY